MKKVYEASDGSITVYQNTVIRVYNSFKEIEDLDDQEFLESRYIQLENIFPKIQKLDDGYNIYFKNGRVEFLKNKNSIYFKFQYEEI